MACKHLAVTLCHTDTAQPCVESELTRHPITTCAPHALQMAMVIISTTADESPRVQSLAMVLWAGYIAYLILTSVCRPAVAHAHRG